MRDTGNIITLEWPDNYGRAWVALLEDERLSEHARICYVAMTSFGRESRAGTKAIMRRMGVKSKATVKAAQSELFITGWAKLLKSATPTEPARWHMLAPSKDGRGEGHHMTPGGSPHDPGEGHDVYPKQEDKQELKQEKAPADAGGTSKLIAIFCEEHLSLKGSTYKLSGKDAGQAKLAAKSNPDLENWFRAACQAYLKDSWSAQTGSTLSAMLAQLNKWASKASGGRQICKHIETTIVETKGTAEAHKCKACGIVTWK